MLCNGPEQELLFPICRTIRRLVDEGKPAVVSTAELFETKMKVLENVTGLRLRLTTRTGHFKDLSSTYILLLLQPLYFTGQFCGFQHSGLVGHHQFLGKKIGGFAGEKGRGEISTDLFEARDIYIYKLPANDECLNIYLNIVAIDIYNHLYIYTYTNICCCIFSYLIGYRRYSIVFFHQSYVQSDLFQRVDGKARIGLMHRRLFEIAQIFQMACLFVL